MQTSLWRAEEAIKRTALENWKTKTTDETAKKLIESRFLVRYDDSPLSKLQSGIYRIGIKDTPRGGSLCSEWIRRRRACCTAYKARTKTARSRVLRAFARRRTLARVFAAKDKMSGAARGTLYHWLFEHFDFTGDLRAQLSSFMQQELISTEERKRIRIADFEYFVQTSLGKKSSKRRKKERITARCRLYLECRLKR